MSLPGNPMIRKELRQRLRERRAWVLPTLYILLLSSVVLFAYSESSETQHGANAQGAEIGLAIFAALVFSQVIVLLLMAPVFSAGGITIEKEQRTFASLLTTLLTPLEIWWGKFVSSLLYLMLLLFCSLPLLALCFAFGGVEPTEVLLATVYSILVLATICAVGLFCSVLFRRSVHSTASAYGLVLILSIATALAYMYLDAHRPRIVRSPGDVPNPAFVQAPLLLNPIYPFLSLMERGAINQFPYAVSSCLLYGAMLLLAAAFTMRFLKKSGEQV
jgi:ABC-type transport system involved in multi-copper enzyme maturation permease subunit